MVPNVPEIDRFRDAFASLVLAAAIAGCAGKAPCATSAACPAGTVCQPSGECAPLAAEGRFVRGRWLFASDFGGASNAAPSSPLPATDVLPLGGESEAVAYLAFGPLDREPTVARAWLRLPPHPSFAGVDREATIVAHRTRAFDGGAITRRDEPTALGSAVAESAVVPGGPRPIVLDVTDAVRHAQRRGQAQVWLAVRVRDAEGRPFLLGSPRATDRAGRPRLELWLR